MYRGGLHTGITLPRNGGTLYASKGQGPQATQTQLLDLCPVWAT